MRVINTAMLGEIIRKQRKDKGLTQKQLTELTGLSSSFISDVENGKATVELGKVIQIINILGLNFEINVRR